MTSASRNAMRKYVSKELGTLRRELNCTMEEMASCLNISPRSYYALEKGVSQCSAPVLIRLVNLIPDPEHRLRFMSLLQTQMDRYEKRRTAVRRGDRRPITAGSATCCGGWG